MDRRQARAAAARDALAKGAGNLESAVAGPAIHIEDLSNTAAPDPNGIVASFSSSASEDVRDGAELDGVIGAGAISPPRNITITTTSHTDIDAVACVVVGTDIYGDAQTDTITLTNGGNTTDAGTECFATVTSITIPAQTGTGGAITIGTGEAIGFEKPVVSAGGEPLVLLEVSAGSIVTNGTLLAASAAGPNGSYEPNTSFDAARDTGLVYIVSSLV